MFSQNVTGLLYPLAALLLLGACAVGKSESGAPPPRGLWLLPRKDAQNTARADVPGNMKTAPKEVWAYGGSSGGYAFAQPVRVGGHNAYFLQERSGLELTRADGKKVWSRPTLGVSAVVDLIDFGGKNAAALATLGADGFGLFDVATGKTLWTWATPVNTSLASYKLLREKEATRLYVFVKDALSALCFAFPASGGTPRLLWQNEYPNTYWQNFGPSFAMADMDNDGRPDIVVAGKPGYMGVIDADTGKLKFDLHYPIPGKEHIGRPYGLLQIADMDGDGYKDVVMASCAVEEYIAVVHNERGKGLKLAWSQFVEQDFPQDFRELRPNVTSLADLNGDGKKSLVLGLYNMDGDNRWHTLVFDGMKGFHNRLADLPDRYFWGCYDLDGDGRPEIITSTEKARKFAEKTTVQAVDSRTFQDIATLANVSLTCATLPLPNDTTFYSARFTPLYLTQPDGKRGLLLRRNPSGPEEVWRLAGGKSAFSPLSMTPLSRVALFSDGSGKIGRLDLAIRGEKPAQTPSASGPLVAIANGQRELIVALSDGTVLGGVPDLSRPGHFKSSWKAPGTAPAVWIGSKGERVVCTLSLKGDHIYLSQPSADRPAAAPMVTITPPWPVYNYGWTRSARTLLPFGKESLKLFASVQRGSHALAGLLYDATGKELWRDALDGPYPRTAAVADLEGKGQPTILTDDHGKQIFYDMKGKSRLLAEGWTNVVPGRGDGAKYSVPIVGPFGPDGSLRIVMAPGLDALEILDASGARVAKRSYAEHYEFEWCGAAVAQIRGKGVWDLGMVNAQGVLHCADLTTGESRWTLDLGAKATFPINVVSGDIDGDGRDNFLVGLPNGELLALDEKNGQPVVLWKVKFPTGVKEAILADIDGDGLAEVIVETEDGQVRILK